MGGVGTGGGDRAPHGAEHFIAPEKLGLSPMVHRRVEAPSIEVTPQAIPPLLTRRGMPR